MVNGRQSRFWGKWKWKYTVGRQASYCIPFFLGGTVEQRGLRGTAQVEEAAMTWLQVQVQSKGCFTGLSPLSTRKIRSVVLISGTIVKHFVTQLLGWSCIQFLVWSLGSYHSHWKCELNTSARIVSLRGKLILFKLIDIICVNSVEKLFGHRICWRRWIGGRSLLEVERTDALIGSWREQV